MQMRRFSKLISLLIALNVNASPHKKQDADYVKIWCSEHNGRTQLPLPNGLRPDCTTEGYVVEVDFARDWRRNVDQALSYGNSSEKKALLVLVVETEEDKMYVALAERFVKENQLSLEVTSLVNLNNRDESSNEIDGPVVKMSSSGICHVKKVGSYGNTHNVKKSFNSINDCINGGGKLPGNVSLAELLKGEQEAIAAQELN